MTQPAVLIPDWPADYALQRVAAVSTTRAGGVSAAPYGGEPGHGGLNLGDHVGDQPAAVARNRQLLDALVAARPVWLTQVHGATVVDAARVAGPVLADASFTTEPGVACAILTADCLPVLFRDRAGSVVGAAHAGWRGLAGGVLQNTVAAMRQAAGKHGGCDILAWLGPAIGPRCFEVGADVVAAFSSLHAPAAFVPIAAREGKYLADIYLLARAVLATVDVHAVTGGQHCTVSEPAAFYSYRRDGVTGRQASMVWIAADS
ncbi:MAG: peptidoglycan editing factor PgeF [Janthinobacterium lividum]